MKAGYFIYLKLIYIYLFCKVTQECCNNMVLVPINRKEYQSIASISKTKPSEPCEFRCQDQSIPRTRSPSFSGNAQDLKC